MGLRLVGRGEGRDLRTYPSALLGSDATKGEEVTLRVTLTNPNAAPRSYRWEREHYAEGEDPALLVG